MLAYNEDLDIPPPQDISNVFKAEGLLSCSSYDSNKYKPECLKAKVICSSIIYNGECPDACSISLSIVPNHKTIASIMVVTSSIFQNSMPMQLPDMN